MSGPGSSIAPSLIETLESRTLFGAGGGAGSVELAKGLLDIRGSRKADIIRVVILGSDPTKLQVFINDNSQPRTLVRLADVTAISIRGNNGNDVLTIEESNGPITLPATIDGGKGNDTIEGGSGNDLLLGGDNNDAILGKGGDDYIYGGDGDDDLSGNNGNDRLFGDRGADTLSGGSNEDYLDGGRDNDRLFGDWSNDILLGSQGDDELSGGDGDDTLDGGPDIDTLDGGIGADVLIGGRDEDIITGNVGNDVFSRKDKVGEIKDFGLTDTYGLQKRRKR